MKPNKKFLLLGLALICGQLLCQAQDKQKAELIQKPYEIRIGVGDMLFETMIWHEQSKNYRHTPHFNAEFSYRLLPWLNLGLITDFQYTSWNEGNFYNLSLMPSVRFVYGRWQYAELYSSVAMGLDINGGNEIDIHGHNTSCGFVADLRLLGVQAGKEHWWGFFDIGMMAGMKNKNNIYMMGSQLFRIGVMYKF